MKKAVIVIAVLMMVFCLASTSHAEGSGGHAQGSGKKLLRGVVNCLTGWAELPKNIYQTSVEENLLAGLTVGLGKGIGYTIRRIGAGAYDIVTFPFPIPEDYAPFIEPEFIFSKEE